MYASTVDIDCVSTSDACIDGDVRLINRGSGDNEGRVEVCIGNVWGTVCHGSWGVMDARVICSQLELPSECESLVLVDVIELCVSLHVLYVSICVSVYVSIN